MRGWLALGVIAFTTSASAGNGAAILIPPAEVDVGAGSPIGDALVGPSTEILAGVHWASLYWRPTHFDVGLGFVGSYRQVLPRYDGGFAGAGKPVQDNRLALSGAYFDVAYALENHPHWRTWLAARIETLRGRVNDDRFGTVGVALRIASEVYAAGRAAGGDRGSGAAVVGAVALGIYVEGVHRDLPAELGPNGLSAGFTMRIPFLFAVAH